MQRNLCMDFLQGVCRDLVAVMRIKHFDVLSRCRCRLDSKVM